MPRRSSRLSESTSRQRGRTSDSIQDSSTVSGVVGSASSNNEASVRQEAVVPRVNVPSSRKPIKVSGKKKKKKKNGVATKELAAHKANTMKRAFLAELPLDTLYECAFSGLVSVSIRVFDIIRFDDADIARLAAAWPHLRTLSLCDAGEMVPACTLASLMSLARGCPDLEKLALAIDATELPRDHLEGSTLARSPCRLRKLDVLRAPIGSEPERVASLLTRYFPFLEPLDVEAKLQWDSELPFQQDSQRRERWAEVKRLMPAFLEARKTGIYGRVANRA